MRFGSRTPPAIFPPIFGLFGLGLAWRAAGAGETAQALGEAFLGAVSGILAVALLAYGAKIVRRAGAFSEDLRVLPGRGGLAAGSMAVMSLAAVILPYSADAGAIVLVAGLVLYATVALGVIRYFLGATPPERRVSPVWHLVFVGFIVAPAATLPLGWHSLTQVIFFATLVVAGGIYLVSAMQLRTASVPPPLRPLLAIHLAPASLLAITAFRLGYPMMGDLLAGFAMAIFAGLLFGSRWITRAGFSPLWGALTFPFAAFTMLMLTMFPPGTAVHPAALVLLAAIGLWIPYIAIRTFQMWINGKLARVTNAAPVIPGTI